MLDQLVESKNHSDENTRKSGFVVTTLGVLVAVLVSGWTYSLFAKNYAMSGDFEMSSLVAPVAPVAEAPPPPKPEVKPERTQNNQPNQIILRELYDDVSSSKIPPKNTLGEKDVVSATKFDISKIKLGDVNQIPTNISRSDSTDNTNDCGLCDENADKKDAKPEDDTPKVVAKPSPKPSDAKAPVRQITGGVLNGKAAYLAKPPYPAAARAVRAEGAVHVQVLIDEKGNVTSASIISGHPLLRAVSEAAARQSRFTTTYLSDKPVKVTGVIIYQFKP